MRIDISNGFLRGNLSLYCVTACVAVFFGTGPITVDLGRRHTGYLNSARSPFAMLGRPRDTERHTADGLTHEQLGLLSYWSTKNPPSLLRSFSKSKPKLAKLLYLSYFSPIYIIEYCNYSIKDFITSIMLCV